MKKVFVIITLFIFAHSLLRAQIKWREYSTTANESDGLPCIMTAIRTVNNFFWVSKRNNSVLDSLKNTTPFFTSHSRNFYSLETYDSSKVYFFAPNINPANAKQFEFRILLNGKEIVVPWHNIDRFADKDVTVNMGTKFMGYLGGYKTIIGNYLLIDLRKKKTKNILSSVAVFWRPIKPIILNIYISNDLNDLNNFLNRVRNPWPYKLSKEEINKWRKSYPANQIDEKTLLPKKLILSSKENSIIFYLKSNILQKEALEYELVKNNKIDINWKQNDFDNNFIWLKDLTPGNFLLKIRYSIQPTHITEFPFEYQ